jgi:hypothetical protein
VSGKCISEGFPSEESCNRLGEKLSHLLRSLRDLFTEARTLVDHRDEVFEVVMEQVAASSAGVRLELGRTEVRGIEVPNRTFGRVRHGRVLARPLVPDVREAKNSRVDGHDVDPHAI